jgi:hypothetical protein
MENECRQFQFVFANNSGIRYRSPEACHSWGKAGVISLVASQDIEGTENLLPFRSQRIGAGKKSQPPARLIYLSEANPLLRSVLSACAGMQFSTENRLIKVYFTIPDL